MPDFIQEFDDLELHLQQLRVQQKTFKPSKPGTSEIIILPRKRGVFFVEYGVHWGLQVISGGDVHRVGCLKKTLGQICPLCEYQKRLYWETKQNPQNISEAKVNLAKELRVQSKYVMNIIELDDLRSGVQLWEIGFKIYKQLIGMFEEWRDVVPTREAPNSCRILKVRYEELKGFGNCCESITATGKTKEIPIEDWKERLHDLDAWAQRNLVSADEMRRLVKAANQLLGDQMLKERQSSEEEEEPKFSPAPHEEEPEEVPAIIPHTKDEEDDEDEQEDEDEGKAAQLLAEQLQNQLKRLKARKNAAPPF